MKRTVLISVILVLATLTLSAGTPAEELVDKYKDVKKARNLVAKGSLIKMARPLMKDYQIAPLAHKVEELSVLRMDRVSPEIRDEFIREMRIALSRYVYAGQSDTPNGVVDAYVHLVSDNTADELVVYNPEIYAIYSLSGIFTAEELLSIQKKP